MVCGFFIFFIREFLQHGAGVVKVLSMRSYYSTSLYMTTKQRFPILDFVLFLLLFCVLPRIAFLRISLPLLSFLFRKASKDEFPLPSYSESSFESSGVPLKSGLNVKLDVDEAAKVEAEAEDKDRGKHHYMHSRMTS